MQTTLFSLVSIPPLSPALPRSYYYSLSLTFSTRHFFLERAISRYDAAATGGAAETTRILKFKTLKLRNPARLGDRVHVHVAAAKAKASNLSVKISTSDSVELSSCNRYNRRLFILIHEPKQALLIYLFLQY